MRKIVSYLVLTILCCSNIYAQKLTLTDLTNLCNKKNWEEVNQTLRTKGWEYHESSKGNTYQYNTITWSYEKSHYDDKASAWFYLFTYDGFPNKITYTVHNQDSYSIIQRSIATTGFKLTDSEIENNEIISTYANSNYTLKISTRKTTRDDYWGSSITTYSITLIKKAGIYDLDNGKKTDYFYDGKIEAEYTLLNGKLNGQLKVYYRNGKIKKIGNFSNGAENGQFKEYDEDGNLTAEYTMKNGKKNGIFKFYENGEISSSTIYKEDVKNGQHIEYFYNKETGKLNGKYIGNYLNDEKNDIWKLVYLEDNDKEKTLTFKTYSNGVKNGAFQKAKGDSLIIGNYKNDKLNGTYKVYFDSLRLLFGGVINTDISKLTLITDGNYIDDKESGRWKYYDFFSGSLTQEGIYYNGLKTGEWKYYYPLRTDDVTGETAKYAKQLYLIETYADGKLNGKSTRYSFLDEIEVPCPETKSEESSEMCTRTVCFKILATTNYKNDKRNGAYELKDTINNIISKGFFKDDLKDGEWTERSLEPFNPYYMYTCGNGNVFYKKGSYLKDKKEGKWTEYNEDGKITATFNYKNGELHGDAICESIFYCGQYTPKEKKQFKVGKLTEVITYDSLGVKPINKYEIYDEKYNGYKCRHTRYYTDGSISLEYWVKKRSSEKINYDCFEQIFLITIADIPKSDEIEGYTDGEYKKNNANNQPLVTGKLYKNEMIGLWTFYYYDQNVKIESYYTQSRQTDEKYLKLNGELFSGEFVYYDNESGIREERKIKDGLRNGRTSYIDTNTKKTVRKENYKNGEIK